MVLGKEDRDKTAVIHGVPKSYRDASRSNVNWEQPPTPVLPPTNRVPNPWSQARTKDTLSKGQLFSNGGNPTRGSTLSRSSEIGLEPSPPHKRRKIQDYTFTGKLGIGNSGRAKKISTPKTSKDIPPIAPDREVISIDSDDEDLGQRVDSSDQLNLFLPSPSSSKAPGSTNDKAPHPFEQAEESSTSAPALRHPKVPPDGDSAKWLRNKRKELDARLSSPIEDFDDSPKHSKNEQMGNVQKLVSQYEHKADEGNQSRTLNRKRNNNNVPAVPHLDFYKMSKATPNTVLNIRNQMKPKDPKAHIKPPPNQDPIATSSSGFTNNRPRGRASKSSASSAFSEISLPIKEWFLGYNHFQEPYTLSYTGKNQFNIYKNGHTETVKFVQDIESAECCDRDNACIVLVTKPDDDMRGSPIGIGYRDHFEPGARGRGMLAILFDLSPDMVDGYIELCSAIKNKSTTRGLGPWDMHLQRYEQYKQSEHFKKQSQSTPNTVEEDEIVETKPYLEDASSRPKNIVTYDSKRESAVRSTMLRRSSRQREQATSNVNARTSASSRTTPQVDPDEVILSYPPATAGSVNITNGDLSRLEPGEYLNDTLIEFGLRLWHRELEQTDPKLAGQIHIFNSFFYKKLMANKSNIEETYQSVRRWTSKFDLFEKQFIIVPINEAMHWYLAIIYRPGNVLFSPPEKPPPTTRGRTRQSNANEIVTTKDEDAQEVQDVQAALVEDSSTSEEKARPEATTSVSNEDAVNVETPEDPLAFEASVSTIYEKEPLSRSNPPSPAHMDVTEELPLNSDQMDVDQDMSFTDSRPRSPTASDDDKPTSSTAATGELSPRSDAADLSMEVDELTLEDGDDALDVSEVASADAKTSQTSKPDRKGKDKAIEVIDDDEQLEVEEVGAKNEEGGNNTIPTSFVPTCIFTLDSLGTKHPKVIKNLSKYLQMEAKYKKYNENTSEAVGKQAAVPVQPNFSDCGIYLLHFARVFVRKAEYFCNLKPSFRDGPKRVSDWEAEELGNSREILRKRILELSEKWKRDRATEDEEKKQQADKVGQAEAQEIEDSDDDVQVVNQVPPTSTNSKRGGIGGRGKGKAARMRG